MADDVGQRLLNNAEDGRLDVGLQPGALALGQQLGLDAGALLKGADVAAQGGQQPQVVEDGRPQVGDDVVDFLQHLGVHRLHVGQLAAHRLRVAVQPVGGGGQAQPQRGQRLPRAVVEFAGDALPLRLLGRDDAVEQFAAHLAALLHLVVEGGVLDGDAQLVGDGPRQGGVAQREG